MTKQELINELNRRIDELQKYYENSYLRKNKYDAEYFAGAYNEVTNIKYFIEAKCIKYFIEAKWEDDNKNKLKRKYLVQHSDRYRGYTSIFKANSHEDLLKDWGCFNNTYIDKIYELGDVVYEEKR